MDVKKAEKAAKLTDKIRCLEYDLKHLPKMKIHDGPLFMYDKNHKIVAKSGYLIQTMINKAKRELAKTKKELSEL